MATSIFIMPFDCMDNSVFIGPSHKKIKFSTFFCRKTFSDGIAVAVLKSPFIIGVFVKDDTFSGMEKCYEDDSSC